MKAIQIERFGGPDELRLVDAARPEPKPGEALIRVTCAGVNYIDVYMRDGSYRRSHTYVTDLPFTIGMEGAGRVVATGAGVANLAAGDRVAWCIVRGAYAEYAAVPAWKLVKVPDDVPFPVATALMLQGFTAHYLTHSAFRLGPGQTCLVHAAAGGVGQLLVQLAKHAGATVIGTVGSPEKAALAKARGLDHAILYRETDFREAVMALTGGQGVDVVYDSVGKDTVPKSIRSLKRRGVCVNFGASSGQADPIVPLDLAEAGSVFFTRPHLADYIATADEIRTRADDLFAAYRSGALAVTIDRTLPLAAAADAHRIIEGRGTTGKLLLTVAEDVP
jgi:NADPH2:quinone reductase